MTMIMIALTDKNLLTRQLYIRLCRPSRQDMAEIVVEIITKLWMILLMTQTVVY